VSAGVATHRREVVRVARPARIRGSVEVSGDKSISHRAAMFNALARGRATIDNYSPGADTLSTLACLRALGVEVEYQTGPAGAARDGATSDDGAGARPEGAANAAGGRPRVVIDGAAGLFADPLRPLDCGNSGTSMRLLGGILAGQPIFSVLTGDDSLSGRPMGRIVDPLRQMGARITGRQGGRYAPLAIDGGELKAIDYAAPVASAQIKSCVLLAGLQADGLTTVTAPAASRDHTERMLAAQGAEVTVDGASVAIRGGARLRAVDVVVPGDFSSAAYWLALGCLHPDAEVTIRNVGINPGRTGFLDILREMGADVTVVNERVVAGEPRADLVARSSRLRGTVVGGDVVPRAIDELPLVAVLGLFAEGTTEIRDAAELRVKESDRIASLAREIGRMGGDVEERPNGLAVRGGRTLEDAACETYSDHRLAMSLAIAGLVGPRIDILGAECASISYPAFWDHARALGGTVSVLEPAR